MLRVILTRFQLFGRGKVEQNVVKVENDKKVSLLYYILPFKFWLSLRTDIAVCNNSLLSSHDFFFMFPSM